MLWTSFTLLPLATSLAVGTGFPAGSVTKGTLETVFGLALSVTRKALDRSVAGPFAGRACGGFGHLRQADGANGKSADPENQSQNRTQGNSSSLQHVFLLRNEV